MLTKTMMPAPFTASCYPTRTRQVADGNRCSAAVISSSCDDAGFVLSFDMHSRCYIVASIRRNGILDERTGSYNCGSYMHGGCGACWPAYRRWLSLSDGAQFELTSDRGADGQTFYL